jgi:hypothetical protein
LPTIIKPGRGDGQEKTHKFSITDELSDNITVMESSLDIAISNLTSITVLIFFLGLLAGAIRSDVKIPEAIYQFIAIYLLFGIGLKGGVSLRESNLIDTLLPIVATLALGITIPVLAFLALGRITKISELDRGSLAAHYGSTSLVTFTAALVYLDNNQITFNCDGSSGNCGWNIFSKATYCTKNQLVRIFAGDIPR